MVGSGDGQLRSPDTVSRSPKSVECLGRCDLVHQMQVDVENRWLPRLLMDYVSVPYFLEHGCWGHSQIAFYCPLSVGASASGGCPYATPSDAILSKQQGTGYGTLAFSIARRRFSAFM